MLNNNGFKYEKKNAVISNCVFYFYTIKISMYILKFKVLAVDQKDKMISKLDTLGKFGTKIYLK